MEFSQHTTLTQTDWQQWVGRNIQTDDGAVERATEPSLTVDRLSITAIDLAVDTDGNQYALRPSGAVYRHNQQRGIEQRLWQPQDHNVADPRALCVIGDQIYVIDGGTGALSVISSRLQESIGTVDTGVTEPVTMTALDGRPCILDAESGAVVTVASTGAVETVFESLSLPIDMTVDERGAIYVLEEQIDHRDVQKQAATGAMVTGRIPVGRQRQLRKQTPAGGCDPDRFPLDSFETTSGTSFTPTRLGTAVDAPFLLIGETDTGDQPIVVDVDPETSTYRKRHRLSGDCHRFITPTTRAGDHASYAIVGETNQRLRLDPTQTYVRDQAREAYESAAYRQFDAGTEGIQWHQLSVDRDRPTASTQVRLSYFASDDPAPLNEPLSSVTGLSDSFLETNEIETVWDLLAYDPAGLALLAEKMTVGDAADCLSTALDALEAATSGQWQSTGSTAEELLLSEAIGRYLTVRLELVGSRTSSPRVSSLQATWPRQSYLQYLPEIYRDDPASGAFLEQFLSVFGASFTEFESQIKTVSQYFDPGAAPAETLPWLAEWLAVDAGDQWPTAAVRELVASAPERYEHRGTKAGLRDRLLLYLSHIRSPETPPTDQLVPDECSDTGVDVDMTAVEHGLLILEAQDLDSVDSPAREVYERLLSGSQSFAVFAGPFADSEHRQGVADIMKKQKPAHVRSELIELEPSLTLGADSFLGVNSRLSEREFELGDGALGETAVLDRSDDTSGWSEA